jgi:hypothetical protein
MNRTIPIVIAAVALGCPACGSPSTSGSAGHATTAPTSSLTAAGYTGPTIPDGTYRYVDKPADVIRVGYPASRTTALLGTDRREPIVLKVAGLQWSVFDDEGDGTGLGDLGTYRYVSAHLVYMVSRSTGCPGCTQLWHWSAPQGSLTLVERKDVRDDAQNDPRDERLVVEHTYTKVG